MSLSVTQLLILVGVLTLLMNATRVMEILQEAMQNLRNGRGPGAPSHPLPSNDSRILNRRQRKPEAGS